jgi:hypothetical protein
VNRLLDDDPGVAVGQDGAQDGYITVNAVNLEGDQPRRVVEHLRAILDR